MRSPLLRPVVWLVFGLVLLSGCGKKVTIVTGNVTYDGEPVAVGYISFSDERGEGGGGPIRNGRYRAEVPPGRMTVLVVAGDTSGTRAKTSGDEVGKVTPQVTRQRDDLIPPDAEGNNQVVEISGKSKKLDIDLTRPKRPPPTAAPVPGQLPGPRQPGVQQPRQPGGRGTANVSPAKKKN